MKFAVFGCFLKKKVKKLLSAGGLLGKNREASLMNWSKSYFSKAKLNSMDGLNKLPYWPTRNCSEGEHALLVLKL